MFKGGAIKGRNTCFCVFLTKKITFVPEPSLILVHPYINTVQNSVRLWRTRDWNVLGLSPAG